MMSHPPPAYRASNAQMRQYVLPPVLLVTALWVFMSSITTVYLYWIGQSHQRILSQNLSSISAADELHRAARRLRQDWAEKLVDHNAFQHFWKEASLELDECEETLRRSTQTPEEISELDQLSGLLKQLRAETTALISLRHPAAAPVTAADMANSSEKVRELLAAISAHAAELKRINHRIIETTGLKNSLISNLILAVRMFLLVVGPIIGVYLGWRLSTRLQKSVSQIAVTLQRAESSQVVDLGTVSLHSEGLLGDVRWQAEQVVARLQEANLDLQQARNEVIRAERLAAVGELAAGVAHELRNPLTSVKLLLQHAIQSPQSVGLNESKLQLILEEIGRMETIIQGLLDFSRPGTLRRAYHDIRETLQRALNLVEGRARHQGIEISKAEGQNPLLVNGDSEQLHQVLVNLLLNAIEAMPNGGQLSVAVFRSVDEHFVQMEIRDTGAGISSEVLSRLFEPFTTTKDQGTGLGLAISRRIVEQHGGTLVASNHPDGGAVFVVTLPVIGAAHNEVPAVIREPESAFSR